MEWRQFVMNLESIEPDRLEEVLLRHGAQSLTLSDAGDDPVLEPEPGTAPLWSTTRITALFAANADFERLRTDLKQTLAVDTLPRNRVEALADRDWEREWLKDFMPMRFGERLWVSPDGFVVDADDAARILGAPATVDTTPSPSFGETSVCAWLTGSDALLVVSLFEGRQFYGGNDLPGSEALALGDEGYIGVEPTFGGVNLQVIKGEWVLSMSAAPFAIVDVEGLPANMTAVAQQALDRLP